MRTNCREKTHAFVRLHVYVYVRLVVFVCICRCIYRMSLQDVFTRCIYTNDPRICVYGVATISRLLAIIGLFCEKEPYKRNDILQKRPIILRCLLIVATP